MKTLDQASDIADSLTLPDKARFAVAWQNPTTRKIYPVGLLDVAPSMYVFRYLVRVHQADGFVPFIGFPDLDRTYVATRLFPFFEQRVMDPRRPDFPDYVAALGLTAGASQIELLSRSSGNRIGDTVRLSREPVIDGQGRCAYDFPVHGARHVLDGGSADRVLLDLRPGDALSLRDESSNPVNPRAVQIATFDGGAVLGWVPDLLLDFVHLLRAEGVVDVTALHVNKADQPKHMSLIVRLQGSGSPGLRAFSGPEWDPINADE